jgi:pimeloyl-ACP methyl ester carboxylesterase
MHVATFLDRRRYVETPSGRIAYVEMGEGPVVLFDHGVFLNGLLWRPVMERLAGEYRCIALDILCHGATATLCGSGCLLRRQCLHAGRIRRRTWHRVLSPRRH